MKYVDNTGKIWKGSSEFIVYCMYENANEWAQKQYKNLDEYMQDVAYRVYAMDEVFIYSPYDDDTLQERIDYFFDGLIELNYLTEIKK